MDVFLKRGIDLFKVLKSVKKEILFCYFLKFYFEFGLIEL